MAIHKKLFDFQKQNITIEKDGVNPHFKSSYTTLNEVLGKVKKPLNDLGILIIQEPCLEGLKTTLYDTEDGSVVTCTMPYVELTTAQKLGSCNTYLRRYSLITLLGLEEDDDDGNEASKPIVKIPSKQEALESAIKAIGNAKSIKECQALDKRITESKVLDESQKIDLAFELQSKILTFDPTTD